MYKQTIKTTRGVAIVGLLSIAILSSCTSGLVILKQKMATKPSIAVVGTDSISAGISYSLRVSQVLREQRGNDRISLKAEELMGLTAKIVEGLKESLPEQKVFEAKAGVKKVQFFGAMMDAPDYSKIDADIIVVVSVNGRFDENDPMGGEKAPYKYQLSLFANLYFYDKKEMPKIITTQDIGTAKTAYSKDYEFSQLIVNLKDAVDLKPAIQKLIEGAKSETQKIIAEMNKIKDKK